MRGWKGWWFFHLLTCGSPSPSILRNCRCERARHQRQRQEGQAGADTRTEPRSASGRMRPTPEQLEGAA